MLRLEDRLRIALGAGMGVQLQSSEVEVMCRMLVALRMVRQANNIIHVRHTVKEALLPFEDEGNEV